MTKPKSKRTFRMIDGRPAKRQRPATYSVAVAPTAAQSLADLVSLTAPEPRHPDEFTASEFVAQAIAQGRVMSLRQAQRLLDRLTDSNQLASRIVFGRPSPTRVWRRLPTSP